MKFAEVMRRRRRSPVDAAARGLAAGAIGTAVMTAGQLAYLKATGGESSSTPAEVGKRIIEGVFKREVPEERMELLNNVMHIAYGTSWGAAYGLARRGRANAGPTSGLAFGAVVWAASLVHLPAMKLAPPVWEYSPKDIAPDLGFHLLYGAGVGAGFRAVG
jgi:hypothetical protein